MENKVTFSIQGKIWLYPGAAGWHFVDVNKTISQQIKWMEDKKKVGWGYVPIIAKTGATEWDTTLFPSKEGHYLLAIKAVVRKKEKLQAGDTVKIDFHLR